VDNARHAWRCHWKPIFLGCTTLILGGCGGSSSPANGNSPPPPPPPATYSLGGTISGLSATGLVLANGSDTLSVASGATTFTFGTPLASGASYDVTVQTQPAGETCAVSQATGTMPASAVTDVTVNCGASTYSIGGTISGLGADAGLVLLDNGGYATTVPANATTFTMSTRLTHGSAYQVTVGTQPYGITLACTVSNGSGMVSADVTSIVVSCGTVTPTQTAIASYFYNPRGVAMDALGDVFVADTGNSAVEEIPYSNGSYGDAVALGSGFRNPEAVALDSNGDVFVADSSNGAVKEIPYSNGSYGAPVTLASGFNVPAGIAVDAHGNVFVVTLSGVEEIPDNSGTYGAAISFGPGTGGVGVAVDPAGNVFLADQTDKAIEEVPFTGSGYGTPVTIATGFYNIFGIAADSSGNVFVADQGPSTPNTPGGIVKEIPNSAGTFGTPIVLSAGYLDQPDGLVVNASGSVFVVDTPDCAVKEIADTSGNYGAPFVIGPQFNLPSALAVDAQGDLFVADTGDGAVKEIPYSGGAYGQPATIGTGFNVPIGVALDAGGDIFVSNLGDDTLQEIRYGNGSYGTPSILGTGAMYSRNIAVDGHGNVFAAGATTVTELPFSGGGYGQPISLGTYTNTIPYGVGVDAGDDVFVAEEGVNSVVEIPFSSSGYGAPITLSTAFLEPADVVADANGNLFVIDIDGLWEMSYFNGSYSAPLIMGSGFFAPAGDAIDKNGRVYVIDAGHIWLFTP